MEYTISNNVEVVPDGSAGPHNALKPGWNLADWSLWAGHFQNGDDLEALASSSFGSSDWLWDGADTALFSKQTRMLLAIALKVPDVVQLAGRNFQAVVCTKYQGQLLLHTAHNFSLARCQSSIYNSVDDELFLVNVKKADSFEYDFSLQIFENVCILFNNHAHVGWMLQQASSYLISGAGPHQSRYATSASKKSALRRYLGYFNEEAANRMEEEDPAIKEELMAFLAELDQKHDPQFASISEGIANLLDGYFGIEPVRPTEPVA
ncbi:hypothetical protein GCM10022409_09100 [Hymenobacter glaciei]|uniref:Uncharacterized protein n=1 Tax=Hymenobacter glaciei TaxID=877209 RepID=A0ABP7TJR5_9BACT